MPLKEIAMERTDEGECHAAVDGGILNEDWDDNGANESVHNEAELSIIETSDMYACPLLSFDPFFFCSFCCFFILLFFSFS
jgi:hypothetical protein